ncbi:YqiA/YcfP family alpha/beta fold hydrolase [Diaphorobacter caeni]|uniref:YqiA/YcfP family alpha/beta fold hydrolase n=1 Tax=Diaphorobacter caeni TaxID=2784387 RepID=UPI00188EF348|nr:YqiA/YcfP family alpha/beta fold hydrolase [Diaphorobacter caeni]MBF5007276.1 hypothetical protein [Diaphorobacter caeni]
MCDAICRFTVDNDPHRQTPNRRKSTSRRRIHGAGSQNPGVTGMNSHIQANKKMFLDDERMPPGDESQWRICRSSNDAMQAMLQQGVPDFISFDHDLGGDDTAMIFVKWLIDKDLDSLGFIPAEFSFEIHSQNPIGAHNLRQTLYGYLTYRDQGPRAAVQAPTLPDKESHTLANILYIHGHGSSGNSEKATQLKAQLESLGHKVHVPTHQSDPRIDLRMLEGMMESEGIEAVIGSSLGGLYALLLSERFGTSAFLINPSLHPEDSVFREHSERSAIKAALDSFKTDAPDKKEWPDNGYSQLDWPRITMAIAMDDERIDVPYTVETLTRAHTLKFHDGRGHQFKNVGDLVPHIVEWLKR